MPTQDSSLPLSAAHDRCKPRGTRRGRIRGPPTLRMSGASSGLCSCDRRKSGVPGPEGKSPFPAPGTQPVSQLALYFGFWSGLLFSAECPLAGLPTSYWELPALGHVFQGKSPQLKQFESGILCYWKLQNNATLTEGPLQRWWGKKHLSYKAKIWIPCFRNDYKRSPYQIPKRGERSAVE